MRNHDDNERRTRIRRGVPSSFLIHHDEVASTTHAIYCWNGRHRYFPPSAATRSGWKQGRKSSSLTQFDVWVVQIVIIGGWATTIGAFSDNPLCCFHAAATRSCFGWTAPHYY